MGVIRMLVFPYGLIQHRDYAYDSVQTVYAVTSKKIPIIINITFDSSQRFIHCTGWA